jgi:hypothetical protein
MRIVRAITPDETILRWLRSEWWKLEPSFPARTRHLIEHPNLDDPQQNQARAAILYSHRRPLLDPIPSDARCQQVLIEEADLPKLFILTCWDWYLDTGGTFALTNTLAHLKRDRGGVIGGSRERVDHVSTVNEKIPFVRHHDAATSDEYLILVAAHENGPYTIIDGTHRAAALLAQHQEAPNMPWNGIFIESPMMGRNRWHIAFDQTPEILSELRALADRGELW